MGSSGIWVCLHTFYTMASIIKRGNTYQVQVRRKGAPSISKCFKTLAAAKAWARQTEAPIDMGHMPKPQPKVSLHDALTRYAAEVIPHKKAAVQEASFIRLWQRETLAHKMLSDITGSDVATYRDEQLAQGLKPASVVRMLAVLSHLYTVAAKEWGYTVDNPTLNVRKPKVANARSRRPTAEEMQRIISNLPSDEMRVFVQLAAETAMRRSELFHLEWRCVDLEQRHVFLQDTKNGRSRSVLLSSRAVQLFESLPRVGERVFTFIHKDTPSKAFARAVKQANLHNLRLHDMRHEATSSLFERGLAVMEVASITGHRSLSMLSRYTHLSSSHLLAKLG
jgi:integrase